MSCPIADYAKSGMEMVKMASTYALFATLYVATFCLSLLLAMAGPSISAANRLIGYLSQLLSFPVGCLLAVFVLLRIGTLSVKVGPILCSTTHCIQFNYLLFQNLCVAGISASKECVVDIYQDSVASLKGYMSTAGVKVGEVLEPSLKVRDEVGTICAIAVW